MRLINALFITLLLGWTMIVLAPEVLAGSMQVSPTRLNLTPEEARGTLTISNLGEGDMTAQVRGYLWSQTADGQEVLTPAENLIVVPPIFTLEGGAEQVIRIGLRRPPQTSAEMTFRVVVTQLPSGPLEPGVLTSLLSFSMPIFITPEGAAANPEWTAEVLGPREVQIQLTNTGSAHIQMTGFTLVSAADPEVLLSAPDFSALVYVLPGSTVQFTVPLAQDLPEEGYLLQAETTNGPLEQIFPLP